MKRLYVPLFLLLSACSTAPSRPLPPVIDGKTGERVPEPPPGPAPGVPYEMPDKPVAVPVPPVTSAGGAVVALLDQADSYHRSGDSNNEAAVVERALRIDPNNASLWNRLAAIRLDQGRPQQAEQLALKSNALAGTDRALQARNWRLVARARWSQNDGAGARAAEKRAADLGG
jgi:predicted Zn-dependent protease